MQDKQANQTNGQKSGEIACILPCLVQRRQPDKQGQNQTNRTFAAVSQGMNCISQQETVRFGISVQSAKKSDYASYAQALFSVSQALCSVSFILSGKLQKKHCLFEKDVL
ncbi:hypothetical protein [Ruminococcus sp.]